MIPGQPDDGRSVPAVVCFCRESGGALHADVRDVLRRRDLVRTLDARGTLGDAAAVAGHLFVCQTDLTRLACDAVVVPCDGWLHVREDWRPFLGAHLPPEGQTAPGSWPRLRRLTLSDGHAAADLVDGIEVQVVDTVEPRDVAGLSERVVEAVRRVGSRVVVDDDSGRVKPLVALPLVGTGAGGLEHRRGAVIEALLPALQAFVTAHEIDVALVLFDQRDHAAVQARRAHDSGAGELGELAEPADRLGALAARGELSLFVGSGVGVPLGLPSWPRLLERLEATVEDGDDLLVVAETAVERLGPDEYRRRMVEIFRIGRHALSHALVAGLRARQMVTTNYDPCLESALRPVWGGDGFRVMTSSLATSGLPWLLKLHGDVAHPETLVLTKSEYQALEEGHPGLHGIVESLMLTSHLLFVGFGLRDADYVQLARGVAQTRAQARLPTGAMLPPAGSALALSPEAVRDAHVDGLEVHHLSPRADDRVAARRLEILLDRVAMVATRGSAHAAAYFLDDRYDEAFTDPGDVALRRRLGELAGDPGVRSSSAWPAVADLLERLGRR